MLHSGGGKDKGAKRACAPVSTVQGRHLEGQDMEFRNLAAAGKFAFALQTVIFLHP